MNLADAAEAVLQDENGGLTAKEIAQRAVDRGLVAPRSETPWVYVAAAIRKDNRRRERSGAAPRFTRADDGRFSLAQS